MEEVVGDWSPLIGEEFNKPYMQQLSKDISAYRHNFFGNFKSNEDYFEIFKKTPMMSTKLLYIVDLPIFNNQVLYDIESDLFGLNLNLVTHTDYDWLLAQGVMIFPRMLSWEEGGNGHREWKVFTDEVIRLLTYHHSELLIISDDVSLNEMLKQIRSNINVIPKSNCWSKADEYCKKHFNVEIEWEPATLKN